MLDLIFEWIAAVLVLAGALLSVAAAVGILRFGDVLVRLHAVTKPQVLGLLLVLLGIAIGERSWLTLLAISPVFIFQALTAPVAAHMVARSAYRANEGELKLLYQDDLFQAVSKAKE